MKRLGRCSRKRIVVQENEDLSIRVIHNGISIEKTFDINQIFDFVMNKFKEE
jgi:hypothetical protein|tara:strand:- start:308 stop:463 length:156 start_codon:yes stop_codon:yes gene_type:complete